MKKPIELQRDAKFRRAAKNWTKKVAIVPAARDDDHDGGHDDHGDQDDAIKKILREVKIAIMSAAKSNQAGGSESTRIVAISAFC